jgi:hypothetical protein
MLNGGPEHQDAQKYVHDIIKQYDHPEALKALSAVVAILRMVAGSLWDGTQGMNHERQLQGRIDATVMTDVGLAIEEHVKAHRH